MPTLRILISRPDRIGDVVLSTPLPREIKRKYPDSFVAMLVNEQTRDIFFNNPFVDKIILLTESQKTKRFWVLVHEIRRLSFTHAFMLLPNERINWILFMSMIPYRIGVGHKLYQYLSFSKYIDRKKYIENRHETDYCLDMIRKIGIDPVSIDPEIFLSSGEIEEMNEFRKRVGNNRKVIGVNSTSGGSTANLPVDEYLKLINKLSTMKNIQVVVTDFNVPNELDGIKKVVYPVKETSVRKLIKVISSLDVLISASTGPMHIAAALKIPSISVFCPLPACSPKLWGPRGNKSEIILPDESYCNTVCPGDPKKCSFIGVGGIDHTSVLNSLYELFPDIENNLDLAL